MPQRPLKKRITCRVCGADFYPHEKWQIDKEKLLLAEGADVHRFLIYACKAYRKSDIQVISFGGNSELRTFLEALTNLEDFSKVKTLVVARDAETNVTSAVDSVKSALENIELPVPSEPFQFQQGDSTKAAFMLFPGPDRNNQCQTGTIEDLCLATISKDPLLSCVDAFLECAKQNQEGNEKLKHQWKSRLYAYLAGKDDHAGKRLSQAAKDNVWDWEHELMSPFQRIIQEM
jgi:hypothetical protein